MATVRNVSDQDRYVPLLGLTVAADEVVEVPDDQLDGFTCQVGIWADDDAPADDATPAPRTRRHKAAADTDKPEDK